MVYNNAYLECLEAGLRPLLPQWGIDKAAELALLTFSENATFLVKEMATAQRLILRVHRPGCSTPQEINSELAWLHAVKAQGNINVAASIAMLNGEHIAELKEGNTSTWVVAFEFIPGSEPNSEVNLHHWYRRLGQTAGHLHQHSQQWQRPESFTRRTWCLETIIGAQGFWGDWRAMHPFTPGERALLTQVEDDIKHKLGNYGHASDRFGLVHCDMRLANLLVAGDKLTVIDFDDCGICWYGWDFATAVSFIEDDVRLSEYCQAWVAGYRTVRQFSSCDEEILPVLVMLRRLQLTAWMSSHAETPTAQQLRPGWVENTLTLGKKYLDNQLINRETLQDA